MTGGERHIPSSPADAHPADEFVPVGTRIDLDNCAREPIHIPGSIQP
jgi:chemotaxis family two-component system sensor kinase Cph1